MKEVLNVGTAGNKQKKSGLQANASINYDNEKNQL